MKQFLSIVSLVFTISFILYAVNVSALGLEYYGIEDTINNDLSVHNKIVLQFDTPVRHLDYQLDFDVFNLTSQANFLSADCETQDIDDGSVISCDFIGMTKEKNILTLEFDTDDIIKEDRGEFQFKVNYGISLPVERVFTIITLPENGILSQQIANQSFFPENGKVTTDGRHIIVFWESNNLTLGDNLQYAISYVSPQVRGTFFNTLVVSVTLIVIIVIVGVGVYIRRSPKPKEIIAPLMKDDEKKIIDLINNNGGSCIQRVLVRDSNFSKAKVSRLVKGLRERGVVEVEPIGRTTKVTLKLKS